MLLIPFTQKFLVRWQYFAQLVRKLTPDFSKIQSCTFVEGFVNVFLIMLCAKKSWQLSRSLASWTKFLQSERFTICASRPRLRMSLFNDDFHEYIYTKQAYIKVTLHKSSQDEIYFVVICHRIEQGSSSLQKQRFEKKFPFLIQVVVSAKKEKFHLKSSFEFRVVPVSPHFIFLAILSLFLL